MNIHSNVWQDHLIGLVDLMVVWLVALLAVFILLLLRWKLNEIRISNDKKASVSVFDSHMII